MTKEPVVSVIVPNYNHSLYLEERIESVLNQTFQDFELILMDDCSTDNSRDILNRYEHHPKVSAILLNKENSGNTFKQWHKGIEKAHGQYIWLAESDDAANSLFLEQTITAMQCHPEAVMCVAGSHLIDENSHIMKRPSRDRWRETGEVKLFDGESYVRHNLMYRNYVYNASMVVFRRDVYAHIDLSFQQLRCAGDWQFWAEVALEGKVLEVRSKLNRFRQHTNKVTSRSATTGEGMSDTIDLMKYLLDHVQVSTYKRYMIYGECYLRISRLPVTDEIRSRLLDKAYRVLGVQRKHYWLERVNRILATFMPMLPNHRGDKLK